MFSTIFKYEFQHWLRQPSTYIYATILFTFSLLGMAGTAGAFDGPPTHEGATNFVNAPMGIFQMISYFNKLVLFLLPTIIGLSIYRDFRSQIHTILYTYPFSKRDYLLAKFLSSFCITLLIVATIGVGAYLGTLWPGVHANKIAPFNPLAYIQVYLVYVLPNILLFGSIVFAIVVRSRNIYAAFVAVVLLIILEAVIGRVLAGLDSQYIAALLDPLGNRAAFYYTRYWTLAEQNELLLPVKGVVIYNRLLWSGIALLVLGLVYRHFSFSQNAEPIFKPFKKKVDQAPTTKKQLLRNPIQIQYDFSILQRLKTAWYLSNFELKQILKSWAFISIALGGILFVVFALLQMNMPYDNKVLPVTWVMLDFPVLFFSLVINLLTFLYAGMLVHRARINQMDQLVDLTPVSNGTLLSSKLLALVKLQAILLSLLMIGGIVVQTSQGYYHYEIGHYLFELYALHFVGHLIWAVAAIFIQTTFTNPYLGLFLLILGTMGIGYLPELGWEHYIFRFNEAAPIKYSDLNGYGSQLIPFFVYKLYWSLLGLALFFGALFFWTRGLYDGFKERLLIAKARFKGAAGVSFLLFLLSFLATGYGIYYHDVVKTQSVVSKNDERRWMDAYEANYARFQQMAQPRITALQLTMDIFPKTRAFGATGSYDLVNKSQEPIDTIMLRSGFKVKTQYQLERPFQTIHSDSLTKVDLLVLEKPLLPGDHMQLSFYIKNQPNSLFRVHSEVLTNGTMIWNDIFPRFGYQQLSGNEAVSHPSDSTALANSYAAHDADWIDFEATLSTSADQIAIAPGYLQKEWTENGRRYFHYKMDSKIKFVFGFSSGRYQVLKDKWNETELEIYYHKDHAFNLNRMMNGLKASLDYCTKNFGPYQHRQARIIEFPVTEGSYATTFANSFPFSEIRFIAAVDDTEDGNIDLPFYVTAHEMAHQWWGNQVMPADVAGAKMLTESLSEYVALKVLEKQYGKSKMHQFLKYDLDIYLRGRARSSQPEDPLMYNQGQHHIAYGKGALAFYALSDYLGEDTLNQVLKTFVKKVRFQGPPYPTTEALVADLKAATPDSLQYLITDFFETITLYDNQVVEAKVSKLPNQQFQIDVVLNVQKYRTNEFGEQLKPLPPLADYIDIGIFGANNTELYLQKHRFTQEHNSMRFIVDQQPKSIAIDPYHKLIDRNSTDNKVQI